MADNILSPYEAEAYCEELSVFDIKSIGGARWLAQHEYLEKLNVQAHVSIQNQTEEFVLDALISFDKVPVLVHELISIQVWREHVYPQLVELNFVDKSSMTAYMVFYHECTVLSLLEAIMYNKEAVEAISDSVLDLAEYCYQRIVWLNSRAEEEEIVDLTKKDVRDALNQTGLESLEEQIQGLPFDLATKAVNVMRYLTDHVSVLPLSCLTRLLNVHDLPCLLVPLITNTPWTRTVDGAMQKFYDGSWHTVKDSERLQLTKTEAQVWIALYNVIQDGECRRKYEFSDHNKNELLKLRGHFNDVLIDQLPVLNELRRSMEELAVMATPPAEQSVVMEQLPEIHSQLVKINGKRWRAIAEHQNTKVFNPDQKTLQAQAARLAQTYDLDVLESMLPDDPKCAKCGEPASMRCSRCRGEWYCRRQCQVEAWKAHKSICNMICKADKEAAEAAASATTVSAGGE